MGFADSYTTQEKLSKDPKETGKTVVSNEAYLQAAQLEILANILFKLAQRK